MDGAMLCGRDFRCELRPMRPAGLGPMPQTSDLLDLAMEVERRYLGQFMLDDDGPRPLKNIEMHALVHRNDLARRDPDYLPQCAAMWGFVNR